jgi:DNA-binding FrmR family transcriptional regulator
MAYRCKRTDLRGTKTMAEVCTPPDHSAELRRVKRIKGQLAGIERMIEDRRYCPDILVQTRAASAAIRSLEAELLRSHLSHCVSEAFDANNTEARHEKISELVEIFSRRLPL